MRKFFSVVLYILVGLPLSLSVLMAFSVKPWALDRDFYKRTLTSDKLYAALADPALAAGTDEVLELAGGLKVNGPVYVAALQKRIPVPELKALSTDAVDKTFDWLEGKAAAGKPSLDMKPLKKALVASEGDLARDYVKGIPEKPGVPAKGDLTFRPSSLSEAAMTTAATPVLREGTQTAIPDSVSWPNADKPAITDASQGAVILPPDLDSRILGFTVFTTFILAGLSYLGGRRAADRLRLAGTYILIPSIFVLGIGAVLMATGGIAGSAALGGILPAGVHLVPAAGSGAGSQLASFFAELGRGMARSFFLTGLIGTCAGGFLKSLRRTFDPERLE